jgi:hypothetical protein
MGEISDPPLNAQERGPINAAYSMVISEVRSELIPALPQNVTGRDLMGIRHQLLNLKVELDELLARLEPFSGWEGMSEQP